MHLLQARYTFGRSLNFKSNLITEINFHTTVPKLENKLMSRRKSEVRQNVVDLKLRLELH